MAPLKVESIVQRIDQLLATPKPSPGNAFAVAFSERRLGTITLMEAVYGPGSPQQREMHSQTATWLGLEGVLRGMKADIEAGLIGTVERRALGEVLGDMLGLAKDALADGGQNGKNVAAVLAAAAYEDTIRKMGGTLAGVTGRPDLSKVLDALKNAGALVGPSFTTGQSYLKFRNDALHADWANINAAVVGSCIAFVERLVLDHFS